MTLTDPAALDEAVTRVRRGLDAVDRAASRFRTDSEVCVIAASGRTSHQVSDVLADLLRAALVAADQTDGVVDPTLASVLTELGYGPDGLDGNGGGPGSRRRWSVSRRATWRDVTLEGNRLELPAGTLLDLGATAKAVAADRGAEDVAGRFGCGVLLCLGGDLRATGPGPADGWNVVVQDGDDEPASHIRLTGAQAIATSSTLHRRWRRGTRELHHLIDPATLLPAREVWRTVTVAADTCVRANTLSTEAVVVGDRAPAVLSGSGVAARLVDAAGVVSRIGGWPA